jgi:ABC-type sugar transport system ATPase subunit
MARLELRGIGHRYGASRTLEDISLAVEDGEFLVLVGPSGCGKSTLLRIVAGLIPASEGEILLDGARVNELEPRERDVAMVFQNYALYPHMSVRDNLAFPLRLRREGKAEIGRRVGETAELLGLDELLERKPASLSGGQMQRVALGRAIIRRPKLFLFDEPLSNLDAKLRGELRGEIARLHQRLGVTSLYVTHDQAEAMTMGSRIAVLDRGRIEQVGPPLDVWREPRTRFVAGFIGSPPMNLLRGRIADGCFALGGLKVPAPCEWAGEVVLGVRPHEIELASPGGGDGPWCELVASFVERLGRESLLECDLGGQKLLVSREGELAVEPGARVAIRLPPGALHWFDARTGRRYGAR